MGPESLESQNNDSRLLTLQTLRTRRRPLRAGRKEIFAKNLPAVAERDSFLRRGTKEDPGLQLVIVQRRKGFTTQLLSSLFF